VPHAEQTEPISLDDERRFNFRSENELEKHVRESNTTHRNMDREEMIYMGLFAALGSYTVGWVVVGLIRGRMEWPVLAISWLCLGLGWYGCLIWNGLVK